MYKLEEKALILGSLFHDIGKFEQRCYSNALGKHEVLGEKYVEGLKEYFIKILNNDEDAFKRFKGIIKNHHTGTNDALSNICKISDHLSASERVEKADNEESGAQWQHHFLSSIFSKIRLLNEGELNLRYYKHEMLTKKNYEALIPPYETREDALSSKAHYRNQGNIFISFTNDLEAILNIYKDNEDFDTVINLLLILFEKYMWCIPDFTGSPETDISLFNHLKDVAGISHSLLLNNDINNKNLVLIIGDLPGIQNYIFDVVNKKPAKIIRGRSIYVQILARIFASIFLKNFQLSECSLIMLAGGKFYIITPSGNNFKNNYNKSISEIEKYLADNFFYEMKFASGFELFNYEDLKNKKITFGEVIDKASFNLMEGRHQLFKNEFIENKSFDFVMKETEYYKGDGTITDKMKCAVTGKPMRKGNNKGIHLVGEEITVEKQVNNEYEIGKYITRGTVVIELTEKENEVKVVKPLDEYIINEKNKRIILNPELDSLLEFDGNKTKLLKDTLFIEVANYCSMDKDNVLDFDSMIKKNDGAEVLTLIKGDIDELGLIMSSGLSGDKKNEVQKDFTAISRTTTLSNHLKYFFSFFMNGFLEKWDVSQKKESEILPEERDQFVYTIFAGGDDLMLITPQSSSLKLLKEFNKQFTDFVCENPEVHISYSFTNFKDSTPIRMVAEISELNQLEVKSKLKNIEENSFVAEKNKAGTFIFNSVVKNNRYEELILWKNMLTKWVNDEKNPVSRGTLYSILTISDILKGIELRKDYTKLIWHPIFTHYINRVLKNNNDDYKVSETREFFESMLSLNNNDKKAKKLKELLNPLVCEVIYKTRKIKKEDQHA